MAWTTPGTATAGEVLTAAFWNEQVRDNTAALYDTVRRFGYQQRTTDYNVNQTSVASAADVFSSDITWTADGSSYIIEFFCHRIESSSTAGTWVRLHLVNGAGTDLGIIGYVGYGDGSRQGTQLTYARFPYTPAAGEVSINIRAIYNGAAGVIYGGAGGSGSPLPTYFSVYGPVRA